MAAVTNRIIANALFSPIKEAAKEAGTNIKQAAQKAGNFMVDPKAQSAAFASASATVDDCREKVSLALQTAVNTMENEGYATLSAPIAKLATFSYTPVEVTEEASSVSKLCAKAKNIAGRYHEAVIVNGEKYSRIAGEKTYAAVRAILSPVRMLFKLLQMENVGAIIQDSIALAVGFAVRGTLLALSQVLGHGVAAVAAISSAAALTVLAIGAAVIAVGTAPFWLAAAGVGYVLNKKIDNLQQKLEEGSVDSVSSSVAAQGADGETFSYPTYVPQGPVQRQVQ